MFVCSPAALFLLPLLLSAGEKKPVTVNDLMGVKHILDARIAPDGANVLYTVSALDADGSKYNTDVWRITLASGKAQQMTRGAGRDELPRWSPDGKSFAFLSDRAGSPQLWHMPREGGEPEKLSDQPTPIGDFAWAPDGKSIAILTTDPDTEEEKQFQRERGDVRLIGQHYKLSHLHLLDVATRKTRRLTSGSVHVTSFSWAPDGASLTYAAQPTSRYSDARGSDVYLVAVETGKSKPLVVQPGPDLMPRFAPDGKSILPL